jgi:hypothetical protein
MVWGIIKQQINWANIQNEAEAEAKIKQVWNELSQDMIDALCAQFPTRVRMVGEACGKTIQPLLSARQTTVPIGYLEDARAAIHRPWTAEEDGQLTQICSNVLQKNQRRNWGLIAQWFPSRLTSDVKNRRRILEICECNGKRHPREPAEHPLPRRMDFSISGLLNETASKLWIFVSAKS